MNAAAVDVPGLTQADLDSFFDDLRYIVPTFRIDEQRCRLIVIAPDSSLSEEQIGDLRIELGCWTERFCIDKYGRIACVLFTSQQLEANAAAQELDDANGEMIYHISEKASAAPKQRKNRPPGGALTGNMRAVHDAASAIAAEGQELFDSAVIAQALQDGPKDSKSSPAQRRSNMKRAIEICVRKGHLFRVPGTEDGLSLTRGV